MSVQTNMFGQRAAISFPFVCWTYPGHRRPKIADCSTGLVTKLHAFFSQEFPQFLVSWAHPWSPVPIWTWSRKTVWNSCIFDREACWGLVGLAGPGPFQGLDSLAIHEFWAVSGSQSLVQKISYSFNRLYTWPQREIYLHISSQNELYCTRFADPPTQLQGCMGC